MDNKNLEHEEHKLSPSCNTKKRAWCFTWNNYSEEDIRYLLDIFKNEQYLFGEEIGGTGTHHLQGVMRFKNPRAFNSVRKMFKNNHIEPCKNWKASLNYCSKDGRTYTNLDEKKTRKDRLLCKYENVKFYDWQKKIIEICESEPNDRTINWIWEKKGNKGKSFLAKYIVMKYDAIISDGKKDNVFNQIKTWLDSHRQNEDPKIIILDCPRYNREHINYGVLEQIKNGMIYSGKYEGGICLFGNPHIFIFANSEPDLDCLSFDRWNIIPI